MALLLNRLVLNPLVAGEKQGCHALNTGGAGCSFVQVVTREADAGKRRGADRPALQQNPAG